MRFVLLLWVLLLPQWALAQAEELPWLRPNAADDAAAPGAIQMQAPTIITPSTEKKPVPKTPVVPVETAPVAPVVAAPPTAKLITRVPYSKDAIALEDAQYSTLFALIKFMKKRPDVDIEIYGYAHGLKNPDRHEAAQDLAARRLYKVYDFLKTAGAEMPRIRFFAPAKELHDDTHADRIDITGIRKHVSPEDMIGPMPAPTVVSNPVSAAPVTSPTHP